MIEAQFDTASIARVRLAPSPAYETAVWLATALAGRSHPVLGDPGPAARFALRDREVALAGALVLGCARGHYIPDFLTPKPAPVPPSRVMAEQLDEIRATDPADVEDQLMMLDQDAPALARATRNAAGADRLPRLAAAGLAKFWRAVLCDAWPVLQDTAERDVQRRSAELARRGVGGVLDTLHRSVHWTGSSVVIDKPYREYIALRDTEVVLVPSVLGWSRVAVQLWDPANAMIFYPAVGELSPVGGSADSELLGHGRAAVLRALDVPRSTAELHGIVRLSSSTISHHLKLLTRAGLLTRTRRGRFVLYQQTPAARTLLHPAD